MCSALPNHWQNTFFSVLHACDDLETSFFYLAHKIATKVHTVDPISHFRRNYSHSRFREQCDGLSFVKNVQS